MSPSPAGPSWYQSRKVRHPVIIGLAVLSVAPLVLSGCEDKGSPEYKSRALCEEDVRGGFQQPDTVTFSEVSISADGLHKKDISGQVTATDFDGSQVSGGWSCVADDSAGYWTAQISIDPSLS